jgi:hypothetical protein
MFFYSYFLMSVILYTFLMFLTFFNDSYIPVAWIIQNGFQFSPKLVLLLYIIILLILLILMWVVISYSPTNSLKLIYVDLVILLTLFSLFIFLVIFLYVNKKYLKNCSRWRVLEVYCVRDISLIYGCTFITYWSGWLHLYLRLFLYHNFKAENDEYNGFFTRQMVYISSPTYACFQHRCVHLQYNNGYATQL